MFATWRRKAIRVVLSLLLLTGAAHAAPRLAGQDADVSALTVSGLSSGGHMGVQFHVAHSASVKGVGVLAAGPYYCAGGNEWTAYFNCMTPRAFTPLPALSKLQAATGSLEKAGRIDSTKYLAAAKVWIFSGTRDESVFPEVVSALASYYGHYVNAANVRFVRDRPAGHTMPSADPDVMQACEAIESPYINRCIDKGTGAPYDAAGALLAHLMGASPAVSATETGTLTDFDQREFVNGGPHSISLADAGYVYMPAACRTERCRVHVAFHGCRQYAGLVGTAFVRDAGYNRVAMLTVSSCCTRRRSPVMGGLSTEVSSSIPGVGDWWGYSGADYHTKAAPQIRAVKAMVDRLGQPR